MPPCNAVIRPELPRRDYPNRSPARQQPVRCAPACGFQANPLFASGDFSPKRRAMMSIRSGSRSDACSSRQARFISTSPSRCDRSDSILYPYSMAAKCCHAKVITGGISTPMQCRMPHFPTAMGSPPCAAASYQFVCGSKLRRTRPARMFTPADWSFYLDRGRGCMAMPPGQTGFELRLSSCATAYQYSTLLFGVGSVRTLPPPALPSSSDRD